MLAKLCCGLAALAGTGQGLMFQSEAVHSQWDTWAFVENGTYYAYYLVTEHSPGEGFGVATSADGVHWQDQGYVWHSPEWAAHHWWEGTGAVWRAPDFKETGRYLINYSVDPGNFQKILFAESFDLVHWSAVQGADFEINESYYRRPGRWDCIYSIPVPGATPRKDGDARDGYPRYGFWTATPKAGTMGFGLTEDGVTWRALPSPEMRPAVQAEAGAVEYIPYEKGRGAFFALLGHGDMLSYAAAAPEGPYVAAAKNAKVLQGSCYFARFFRNEANEVLVTHQSFSHVGRTYIAPYKLAKVSPDGVLRLAWWPRNELFKGEALPVAWAAPALLSPAANDTLGAVLEASFTVPNATGCSTESPGFVLEMADGTGLVMLLDGQGSVQACTVRNASDVGTAAASMAPKPVASWGRDLQGDAATGSLLLPGSQARARLLVRRAMLEVYVEDYLFAVHLMPKGMRRLGAHKGLGLRRWDMSLDRQPASELLLL